MTFIQIYVISMVLLRNPTAVQPVTRIEVLRLCRSYEERISTILATEHTKMNKY